jgi:folate-binding protein YgfZ
MKLSHLSDRGVVTVAGDAAGGFLDGLLTSSIGTLRPGEARYAGLLTPQGKLIADCIVIAATGLEAVPDAGYILDCPRQLAETLASRLNFYKLRAKIAIADRSADFAVIATWDGATETGLGLRYLDPRLPALGGRIIVPTGAVDAVAAEFKHPMLATDEYEAHRIGLGVPRGGVDFRYGDAFPHEADMDQLGGVDFNKGCYIGQEVVSRMEHRGTARNRIVPVDYDGTAPEPGTAVMAGNKTLGTMGSAARGHGLALLRLDRLAEAAGAPLTAGVTVLHPRKPDWARFDIPNSKAAE